jgi:hypothetical protein
MPSRASTLVIAALALIAFCRPAGTPSVAAADEAAAQASLLAKQILDESRPQAERRQVIVDHPELALQIVQAMAPSADAGTKEEYRRIPWMWRASVAAGRRNNADEIRGFLDWALPRDDESLRDWQTVVIGGGMVSGLSEAGAWPAERIGEILGEDEALGTRWRVALELASKQADNEDVPTPTRYDSLRLAAMQPWDQRAGQLLRYLAKDVHQEVQQGAISGLGDMHSPYAAQALLSGVEHYSTENKHAMLDALLRDNGRILALLDALAAGRIKRGDLAEQHVKKLKSIEDDSLRSRIRAALGE